jgi:hypothetical protein
VIGAFYSSYSRELQRQSGVSQISDNKIVNDYIGTKSAVSPSASGVGPTVLSTRPDGAFETAGLPASETEKPGVKYIRRIEPRAETILA